MGASQIDFVTASDKVLDNPSTVNRLRKDARENGTPRPGSPYRRAASARADNYSNPTGRGRGSPGKGRACTYDHQPARYQPRSRLRGRPRGRSRSRDLERPPQGKGNPSNFFGERTPSPPPGRIDNRSKWHHMRSKANQLPICRNFNQKGGCSAAKKPPCRFAHECAWCFTKNAAVVNCTCTRPERR